MIINRQNITIAFTGFKALFQNAFAGIKPDHEKFVMQVKSNAAVEQYQWLGATTGFREWVGDRVLQALMLHDYSIKNKTFENTVTVPRDALEDDQYGNFSPLMSQMGQDAAEHPGQLAYAALKAGSVELCYDGQPFFDTEHPVLDADGNEVSVSNHSGGGSTEWYLLDTSRHMRPIIQQNRRAYNFVSLDNEDDENTFMRKQFVYGVDGRLNVGYGLWQLAHASKQDLTAEKFNDAYTAMQELKGDNGKPLGVRPTLLIVPPSLRAKALEIITAEKLANGATNTNRNVVEVMSSPWLV